jgi:carboxyl-terminal processing protease
VNKDGKMKQSRTGGFWGRIFFVVLFISSLLLVSCAQTATNRGAWPASAQEAVYPEVEIVQTAYSSILNRYVVPVSSDTLIVHALQGMQDLLGRDALSFTPGPKVLTVSSQGQSIGVRIAQNPTIPTREMARVFSFVLVNNPSCDRQALAHAAIRAMARLDDHSDLMTADGYKEAQKLTQGKALVETGIDLEKRKGRLIVTGCVDDSPAAKAGIIPEDELLSVNGKSTNGLTIQEAYSLLRGHDDQGVTLTVRRLTQSLVFTMTPQVVLRKDVSHRLFDSCYIYVRVSLFGNKTVLNFDRAVRAAEEASGSEIKGMILDLRGCPGGILDQILDLVNRFVGSGLILSLEGQRTAKFGARNQPGVLNCPLVILTDGFTSAGSEIVAGALQDHGRAIIVGTTTAGNGSIQTIIPLADGSALRLTTHLWRLPLGRLVENTGVVPDIDITREIEIDATKVSEKDGAIGLAVQILAATASGKKEDLMRAARDVANRRTP